MSNIDEIIKVKIKEERIKLSLNQEELGAKINISQQTIAKYESGKAKPNLDTLYKLADVFNCTTDYLLGRSPHRDYRIDHVDYDGETYGIGVRKDSPRKVTIDDVIHLLHEIKEKE